jgi:hypothetical protein
VIDFAALRTKEKYLEELQARGVNVSRNTGSLDCPLCGHDSFSLYESKDGGWRARCHHVTCGFHGDILDFIAQCDGCSRDDLIEAMNRGTRPKPRPRPPARGIDVFGDAPVIPETKKLYATMEELERVIIWSARDDRKGVTGHIARRFPYTNPDTHRVDGIVFRVELSEIKENGKHDKTFRQAIPVVGGFQLKAPPKPRPLYNRTRLRTATHVVVVEGEGKVHALTDLFMLFPETGKYAATCWMMGAEAVAHNDWTPLAGKECVYLWPDNDPADAKTGIRPGMKAMQDVAAQLQSLSNPPLYIRMLNPERDLALGLKEDVVDWCGKTQDMTIEERVDLLTAFFLEGELIGRQTEVLREFEDAAAGRRYSLPMPWHQLMTLSGALKPGTVTMLCGTPGATKSLMTMQLMWWLMDQEYKASMLAMEDSLAYHLRRLLAQRVNEFRLTIDEYVKANFALAAQLYREHEEQLALAARSIFDMGNGTIPTVPTVLSWIKTHAGLGVEIMFIDPYSYIDTGPKPWVTDRQFLVEAKTICKDTGSRLFIVSHPEKHAPTNLKQVTLDNMAGSAALGRFSHCALWLAAHDDDESNVSFPDPLPEAPENEKTENMTHDRTLMILKARDGQPRRKLAFKFKLQSLTLEELGRIV